MKRAVRRPQFHSFGRLKIAQTCPPYNRLKRFSLFYHADAVLAMKHIPKDSSGKTSFTKFMALIKAHMGGINHEATQEAPNSSRYRPGDRYCQRQESRYCYAEQCFKSHGDNSRASRLRNFGRGD